MKSVVVDAASTIFSLLSCRLVTPKCWPAGKGGVQNFRPGSGYLVLGGLRSLQAWTVLAPFSGGNREPEAEATGREVVGPWKRVEAHCAAVPTANTPM